MTSNRMARTVKFLPYHLRHKRRGTSHQGRARNTYGLQVRGVVMKTYIPDDPADTARADARPFSRGAEPCILCDVLITDPEYKTYLKDVPVMLQSAGLNDHEIWRPRASTIDLNGESLNFSLEGGQAPTTATHNMDGDQVIVSFLGNDTGQPIIIGQIPHARTNRRPSFNDPVQFKWRRFMRGIDVGVTMDGNITMDLSAASDGEVTTDGSEIASPGISASGNMTVTMFTGNIPTGAKIRVIDSATSAPEAVVLGDTWLADTSDHITNTTSHLTKLAAALSEIAADLGAFGLPVVNTIAAVAEITALSASSAAFQAKIATARSVGLPYLSSHLEVD